MSRGFIVFIFGVLILLSLRSSSLQAQSLYDESRRYGFYTSLTMGELFFTGADRDLYREGFVTGLKLGYDVFKYTSVETMARFSGHQTSTLTGNQGIPFSFFAYQLLGGLKGSFPITGRLRLSVGAGGGLFYSSPNLNRLVGQRQAAKGMGYVEPGIEYFLRLKGLAIGLDPSVAVVQDLNSIVVQLTGSIRYTF